MISRAVRLWPHPWLAFDAVAQILQRVPDLFLGLAHPMADVASQLVGHAFVVQHGVARGLADLLFCLALYLVELSLDLILVHDLSPAAAARVTARLLTQGLRPRWTGPKA